MTTGGLAAAKARLERVRFFPRDEEENLKLLARAASAVARIRPSLRTDFERLVDEYESALHDTSPERFAAARAALTDRLAALGVGSDGSGQG